MILKIGGDTLALDAEIRRQVEAEAQKLADRFPGEQIEAQVTVQEVLDRLHGHRIRCELSARLSSGHQVVVREARKSAQEAIDEVFSAARRNVRKVRRQSVLDIAPTSRGGVRAVHVAGR